MAVAEAQELAVAAMVVVAMAVDVDRQIIVS
jgi:hypothetical protein